MLLSFVVVVDDAFVATAAAVVVITVINVAPLVKPLIIVTILMS